MPRGIPGPVKKTEKKLERSKFGNLPGPGPGRPKGVPNKFSQQLVADFARDWRAHGAAAIEQLRKENVAAYVKIATSLVPRELLLQVSRPLAELSDDELQAAALQERADRRFADT